jgi:NAD(P)-dependent dehydrogenase (short-subunit alcohol dehydrogenase family)
MLGQGGGAIVNVASESAYKGNAGDAAYTASKHGVWGLTTVAALRSVKRGIRVNAIAPGNVRTGITERAQAVTPPEIWEPSLSPGSAQTRRRQLQLGRGGRRRDDGTGPRHDQPLRLDAKRER